MFDGKVSSERERYIIGACASLKSGCSFAEITPLCAGRPAVAQLAASARQMIKSCFRLACVKVKE